MRLNKISPPDLPPGRLHTVPSIPLHIIVCVCNSSLVGPYYCIYCSLMFGSNQCRKVEILPWYKGGLILWNLTECGTIVLLHICISIIFSIQQLSVMCTIIMMIVMWLVFYGVWRYVWQPPTDQNRRRRYSDPLVGDQLMENLSLTAHPRYLFCQQSTLYSGGGEEFPSISRDQTKV